MKTPKNTLRTGTTPGTAAQDADTVGGGDDTVVGGADSALGGADTVGGGNDTVAGVDAPGLGNAAGTLEERATEDGIISDRDVVEAASQIDPAVSVKEIGEARDPLDESFRRDVDRLAADPARNDLTSGTGPDFTDGKEQPRLAPTFGTIVGRNPIATVADGRPAGSATNNPADAAVDPRLVGDADGRVECLRVEPTADRRRAGRRFRKGRVEHLPLDRISPAERRMIEADPMLSTRIERVDPYARPID